MKRLFFIFLICVCSPFNKLYCQDYWRDLFSGVTNSPSWEIGGGISSLFQTKLPTPLIGINLNFGLESYKVWIGENRHNTYIHLRTSYFFKSGIKSDGFFNAIPKDTLLNIDQIEVPYNYEETVSYFMIDIGKDFYLFTNEKENFSFYTGYIIGINIPTYYGNYLLTDYNEEKYTLQTENEWERNRKIRTTNFKLGLNFGVNYKFGLSNNFYLDTHSFIDLSVNEKIQQYFTIESPFFIGLNIGYRYEF